MKIGIFIDYDNLNSSQKASGILALIRRIFFLQNYPSGIKNIKCDVRIYGGWYEGSSITNLAQKIISEVSADFPCIVRVPLGDTFVPVQANAELAMSLLEDPAHHLFDTYRKKSVPYNLRVKSPGDVGCSHYACPLTMLKKMVSSNMCAMPSCGSQSGDYIYRNEQKITDTMLTCDLIYANKIGFDRIIIVSDDDDFIPPIRTLLVRGGNVFRFSPKPNPRLSNHNVVGNQLMEVNL